MSKKNYVRPSTYVIEVKAARCVCGITTGSQGTEDGGLAKRNDFSLWEDDDDATTAQQSNLWDD